MYKTPNKQYVKIYGTKVLIKIDDERLKAEEADGLFTDEGDILLLSEYESRKEYLRIYRHECIHALCDIMGFQLNENLEEALTHTISTMLTYQV